MNTKKCIKSKPTQKITHVLEDLSKLINNSKVKVK